MEDAANLKEKLIPSYGPNGKFLMPIKPPAKTSIPVSTRNELSSIRQNLKGYYHLIADIDLSGEEWEPIKGSDKKKFTGIFDGQGHVIHNMTVSGGKPAGLFLGLDRSARIRNVGIEGTKFFIVYNQSLDAGMVCSSNTGTISNCYTEGAISVSVGGSWSNFGGICGYNRGVISYCYNTGVILGTELYNIGGICGFNGGIGTISYCYNEGNIVSGHERANVGGICGEIFTGTIKGGRATICNCYNIGNTLDLERKDAWWASGICGGLGSGGDIIDCYDLSNSMQTYYEKDKHPELSDEEINRRLQLPHINS